MSDLHIREFPTSVEFTDGQLFARMVPYDVTARVLDETAAGFEVYDEGFRKGAFARQAASAEPGVLRRVALKHEHDGGLGYLGPMMGLEERDDGVYGSFHVLRQHRDSVAELVELGIREMSVEFMERRGGTVVEDGVRWRTDVHLAAVALLPRGSYGAAGARVLAMRDLDELIAEQAERERVDAEAAAAAEAEAERLRVEQEAADAAAEERRQRLAAIDEFLDRARVEQDELAERFASA